MKKVLILGGSHRDIPLIKACKELAYFVITLGDRDYYLGHKYADQYYKINFNDLIKIKEIVKNEEIDYLIPGSGEESYLNTVKLSEELNMGHFDSLKTANLVHNKWRFKEFCLKNNISVPKGVYVTSSSDITNLNDMNFPIVIKPTNLSGGRGVEVVHTLKDLQSSLKVTEKVSNEIFLEEYIEGELIAYSIILKEQDIIYDFIASDKTYLNPYLITSAFPKKLDKKVVKHIHTEVTKLAKLLSLSNGMFHLQILIKENIPYIIDVTRRIPGDFFPDLMELADGVEYNKAVIQGYTTGNLNANLLKNTKQNFIIRHCVMPSENGIYENIVIDESIKNNIISVFDLLDKGYIIKDYLHTQIAIVFIKLNKYNETVLDNINNLIKVSVKTTHDK